MLDPGAESAPPCPYGAVAFGPSIYMYKTSKQPHVQLESAFFAVVVHAASSAEMPPTTNVADELKGNLPVAMTVAAFVGISWYISVELNVRLFMLFRRKWGLYFWSCCLCSWGILIQPLCFILYDFGVIPPGWLPTILVYLSWWVMVVPQAVILYSRLHLVMNNEKHIRYVLYMIIFTVVFVSIPTVVLGVIGQSLGDPTMAMVNSIWDRIQVGIFFVEESTISILYVIETRRRLRNMPTLSNGDHNTAGNIVMRHLIYTNLFVICLDISLLGLCYSNHFYVQGAYKPCVYGLKLRVEFSILNRLISSVQRSTNVSSGPPSNRNTRHSRVRASGVSNWGWRSVKPKAVVHDTLGGRSQYNEFQMIPGDSSTCDNTEFVHTKTTPTS